MKHGADGKNAGTIFRVLLVELPAFLDEVAQHFVARYVHLFYYKGGLAVLSDGGFLLIENLELVEDIARIDHIFLVEDLAAIEVFVAF